ncbi:MAG: IS66 family transposase [Spirulinaceae cyanobacterium]
MSAIVGLLSAPPYRQSYRQICRLMSEIFDVKLSRGSIGRLREELMAAIREPVAAAKTYVQSQPIINSDETSFNQGNQDGRNPKGRKGWLWVVLSPLVSFFGSQSQQGSCFVAGMLTVSVSLQAQGRAVLTWLTQAVKAVRLGKPAPSLLPSPPASSLSDESFLFFLV